MTEHKDIQNPDDYDAEDYREFEKLLFSPYTSVEKLEEICMTLAHLPTKQAQDLLARFKTSKRASLVCWLETAVEEGQYHYLSPLNDQEERDYLALKVMQEIEDQVIEMETECSGYRHELSKMEIQFEAMRELIARGELSEDEMAGAHDYRLWIENRIEDLEQKIAVKEKIQEQILKSVKTERYQALDPTYMRDIHWT